MWAYGGSALDEAVDEPTYDTTMINSPEGIAALQTYYDMYVRDQSVPTSALTNTQTENQDLFIAGEIAMMISHPSEYAAMQRPRGEGDRRRQGAGRSDRRQHGLRADPGRPGAAGGRLRRLQRPHLHRRGARRPGQSRRGAGAGRGHHRTGVVAEAELDRLQPGEPASGSRRSG